MTIIDGYHAIVGDQGKAYLEIAKWGALYIQRSFYEGQKKVDRKKKIKRLRSQVPNTRVHISGELYRVH